MILLLSNSKLESSTDRLIDWLDYYKAIYFRLNGDDVLNSKSYGIYLTTKYKNNNDKVNSKVKVVWNRRWIYTNELFEELMNDIKLTNNNYYNFKAHLLKEINNLSAYLLSEYNSTNWIPCRFMNNFNKFEVLIKAQNYGVLVPDSIITNKISELKSFYLKHNKKLITKPISDITFYKENDFLSLLS